MSSSFTLSKLDEERFGILSARAEVDSLEGLEEIEAWCNEGSVVFLVARVPTESLNVVQEMERRGYFLTDTLLFLERDLINRELPQPTGSVVVRPARDGEAVRVREIAALAFDGYLGHYHADANFEKEVCDDIYADWAYRGCLDRTVANQVLVAEDIKEVIGFCLIRIEDGNVAVGTLYGVHPGCPGSWGLPGGGGLGDAVGT